MNSYDLCGLSKDSGDDFIRTGDGWFKALEANNKINFDKAENKHVSCSSRRHNLLYSTKGELQQD